jgi:hypothetical protein
MLEKTAGHVGNQRAVAAIRIGTDIAVTWATLESWAGFRLAKSPERRKIDILSEPQGKGRRRDR